MIPQHRYKGFRIVLQFKNSVAYWEARKDGKTFAKGSTRKECEKQVDNLEDSH